MKTTPVIGGAEVRSRESAWVLRFSRTERVAHWVQALSFLTLLATGFLISINVLAEVVGHRALWREVHLWAAFLFVFGPTLVALAGNRAAVATTIREVDEWTDDDITWLAHPSVDPSFTTPPQERFNAGQKLNAIFTLYSTFAFALTGLILWQNRRFPFSVVQQANTIHTMLAYLAFAVVIGHIYLATLHPATKQALHGIIFGTVRRDWAEHHHPLWRPEGTETSLTGSSLARAASLLVLATIVTVLIVRAGLEWLGANPSDPVISVLIRFSSFPGTARAVTGIHIFDLGALFWAGLIAVGWVVLARSSSAS